MTVWTSKRPVPKQAKKEGKRRNRKRTFVMSVVSFSISFSSAVRSANPGRAWRACSLSSVATIFVRSGVQFRSHSFSSISVMERRMESLVIINVRKTSMHGRVHRREAAMFSKMVIRSDRYEVEGRAVRWFGRRAAATEISVCGSYQGRIIGADRASSQNGWDVDGSKGRRWACFPSRVHGKDVTIGCWVSAGGRSK